MTQLHVMELSNIALATLVLLLIYKMCKMVSLSVTDKLTFSADEYFGFQNGPIWNKQV